MENYKNNTIVEYFKKDYYTINELKNTTNKQLIKFYNTLKNDKLFLNYYKKCKSINMIIEAGFFTEKYPNQKESINIFTTPFNKLNLDKTKTNYILLTTGGFAPLHNGHINMLNESKIYLESKGYHIAGAYVSPSHDDYVLKKRNQLKEMNIYNRLNIANNLLLDNDFIMVDPYEGLICKSSVNFTKILYRLLNYLNYHFKDYKFDVIMCYGSDNYKFSKVFESNKIKSICINRDENIIDNSNEYTTYINKYTKISSSEIRSNFKFEKQNIKNKVYYVRDDIDYLNIKNKNNIRQLLFNTFNKYIKNVEFVNIKDEIKFVDNNIISLDFYTKGKYNLNYSRLFNLCDNQIKSNKLIDRINYINDISNIDINKEYILIDDDISSGTTINYIKSNILNNIKIKEVKTIINSDDCYDVNDLRDFIFGSNNGGLTCVLPNGEYVRVPYIFPYIDLYNRSSIIYKNIRKFSKSIIEINKLIYKNYKIKDFENNFILFLESQGYNKNDSFEKYLNDLLNLL